MRFASCLRLFRPRSQRLGRRCECLEQTMAGRVPAIVPVNRDHHAEVVHGVGRLSLAEVAELLAMAAEEQYGAWQQARR